MVPLKFNITLVHTHQVALIEKKNCWLKGVAPVSLMSVHYVSRGMKTRVQDMCYAPLIRNF